MDFIAKSFNIINKYELLKFPNKIKGSLIDEIDPIFKLINNFSEINSLLKNNSDKFRYIYFHKKKVKLILYECEKEIMIDSDKIANTLDKIFYLSLLITENKEIINYKYSIDYIKQLDKSNENNLHLTKMIFSKIILDLIEYYKGFEEYNESTDNFIDTIKNKNIDIIKNKSNILMEFNLEYKDFINKSIEEIYIDIIKAFLHGNKDYINILNIIYQIYLEKIDITNFIFKEISKFLSNDKNIIQKRIMNINDLLNNDKIEFYYILLKYILKNLSYIYQIPFLVDTRTFILKNIKSIKYDSIKKEKLKYLIDTLTGSKYYFEQFGIFPKASRKNNLTVEINNDTSEWVQNIDENSQKERYKNNSQINEKKNDKVIENNKYKMLPTLEKISIILEEIIINYENNKYDKKILINCLRKEGGILIEYDELIKLKKEINFYDLNKKDNKYFLKYESFVKLVNFIKKIDEFISNKYKDKKFGISIKLEHVKSFENENKNGIYNISCKYGFFSPIIVLKLNYKDENILLNGNNKGFNSLICDLNDFLWRYIYLYFHSIYLIHL